MLLRKFGDRLPSVLALIWLSDTILKGALACARHGRLHYDPRGVLTSQSVLSRLIIAAN